MRTVWIAVLLLTGLISPRVSHASADALTYVRFVHALGKAASLDIYVHGVRAIEGIAFKRISDYLELVAGPIRFAAVAHGEPLSIKAIQFEAAIHLQLGKTYTVLMARDEKTQLNAPILLADDNTWPDIDHVRLRVVNVNVRQTFDVSNEGGVPLAKAVAYRAASAYVEMSTVILAPRIALSQSGQFIFQVAQEKLRVGTVYTLFIFDAYDASPADAGLFIGLSIDAQLPLLPVTGEDLTQQWSQHEN